MPWQLVYDEGMVVSDELYEKLTPVSSELFTGFYIEDNEKTLGIADNLVKDGRRSLYVSKPLWL